jgi:hypothetical protein
MSEQVTKDITNEYQMAEDIHGSFDGLSLYISLLMLSVRQTDAPMDKLRNSKPHAALLELVFAAYAAGHRRGYIRGFEDAR